eukprot:360591-Chlamydomonas_euryale.AAC.9
MTTPASDSRGGGSGGGGLDGAAGDVGGRWGALSHDILSAIVAQLEACDVAAARRVCAHWRGCVSASVEHADLRVLPPSAQRRLRPPEQVRCPAGMQACFRTRACMPAHMLAWHEGWVGGRSGDTLSEWTGACVRRNHPWPHGTFGINSARECTPRLSHQAGAAPPHVHLCRHARTSVLPHLRSATLRLPLHASEEWALPAGQSIGGAGTGDTAADVTAEVAVAARALLRDLARLPQLTSLDLGFKLHLTHESVLRRCGRV